MVAVGLPIRRVKNPVLEKSQINISCATSNSAFEGLLFCQFDNYIHIYQSNCNPLFLQISLPPSLTKLFFKQASGSRTENFDLALWMVIRTS